MDLLQLHPSHTGGAGRRWSCSRLQITERLKRIQMRPGVGVGLLYRLVTRVLVEQIGTRWWVKEPPGWFCSRSFSEDHGRCSTSERSQILHTWSGWSMFLMVEEDAVSDMLLGR